MRNKFKALLGVLGVLSVLFLAGCSSDSDVTSRNLSKDADNYKVFRQIVVYNGITGEYVLEVQGYCAMGNDDTSTSISYTCKSPDGFIKDIIRRGDNIMVFAHQLYPVNVSDDYFKVVIKPTTLVPDFELR